MFIYKLLSDKYGLKDIYDFDDQSDVGSYLFVSSY